MRFALVGGHPDGLAFAREMARGGRHEVAVLVGVPAGSGLTARTVGDLEEALADPAVEAVIVAGPPADRPAQLRRALQSERHVVCVHPADETPDIAYEAALIQGDTGHVLMPLLPAAVHPAVAQLARWVLDPAGPVGPIRLVEIDHASAGEVLTAPKGQRPSFPHWEVLRALGGEVAEVSALAAGAEAGPDEPVLVAGRFEGGGLFQVTLVPRQAEDCFELRVLGRRGRASLTFPDGRGTAARLGWISTDGGRQEQTWEAWDPWPALVERFEAAVARTAADAGPVWQDEVRCLELDDAARRSIERRRASTLEYQEVSEEVGFKSTMTLVGCTLLWVMLVLLIASRWVPWLGWFFLPLIVLFLAFQLLRWLLPRSAPEDDVRGAGKPAPGAGPE